MKSILLIFMLMSQMSCATSWMLPESAEEINFSEDKNIGFLSSYERTQRFKNVSSYRVFEAIKKGLTKTGFKLKSADFLSGVVIGEHPISWLDWNSMAGVYFKKEGQDVLVKVKVEGAKDSVIDITKHQQKYRDNILKEIQLLLK
jgi:hypothetical protein